MYQEKTPSAFRAANSKVSWPRAGVAALGPESGHAPEPTASGVLEKPRFFCKLCGKAPNAFRATNSKFPWPRAGARALGPELRTYSQCIFVNLMNSY